MKIPINRVKKLIKSSPQWSMAWILTLCLYFIFIFVVLIVAFPLRSSNTDQRHMQQNEINSFDIDDNELTDDEQKLLQRASELQVQPNQTDILRLAFHEADLNGDSKLTIQELAKLINQRIRSHIEASIRNNPLLFSEIDRAPRNGLITWDEYYAYFLKALGYDDHFIQRVDSKHQKQFDRKTQEMLMRDKALWNEAARSDSYSLTLDEFLAFRHPESSAANLLSLVDDLLQQFDSDGDERLTLDEFSNVVADDLDDKWRRYMLEKTAFQRQQEFKRLIDKNGDGVADRSELLSYVSPKHPRHALQEAATLFTIADRNKDKQLSLQELQDAGKVFMVSRMISTEQNFHDDLR